MTDPRSPVSAVVAAYNEEPTIASVVRALVDSGRFRDIVVVSDGSTDRTSDKARGAGATLVHQFPWKHGKGAAMQHGVTHTDTPYVFFCDADLYGLRPDHVSALIDPVVSGELAMCVGLRDRGRFISWIERFLPLIGGERCLNRRIFEAIPDKYLHGFMVESALNVYCKSHGLNVGTRELHGLHIRRKMQKVGFLRGLKEYVHMGWQIYRAHAILWGARMRKEF